MMWLHPVIGAVAVVLVLWMAGVGIKLRQPSPGDGARRRLHGRVAPVAGVLCLVAALAGVASVAWIRDDMDVAGTTHFIVGWTVVGLAGLAGLTAALRRRVPALRAVHPWVGLLLALACIIVALLGLEHLQ